mmetsp:Transcript_48935/g.146232  ORF Transcript_48935/g.146232 Transcript_48935/m.146232 type:complete len:216 (-) Transcript_48935:14-661(-)
MLAHQPHADTVCEVVAIVAHHVVRVPLEDRFHLRVDEQMELVLPPERPAHVYGARGLPEGGVAGRPVYRVPGVVVFPVEDHRARVPDALQVVTQHPWRNGGCCSLGEVVQVKHHLLLPTAEDVGNEFEVGDLPVHVQVHRLDELGREGRWPYGFDLLSGEARAHVDSLNTEAEEILTVGCLNVLKAQHTAFTPVSDLEHPLHVPQDTAVVFQSLD